MYFVEFKLVEYKFYEFHSNIFYNNQQFYCNKTSSISE